MPFGWVAGKGSVSFRVIRSIRVKKARHLPVARGASKQRSPDIRWWTYISHCAYRPPASANIKQLCHRTQKHRISQKKIGLTSYLLGGREDGFRVHPRPSAKSAIKKTAVKKPTAVNSEFSNKYNPSANPHSGTPPTTDGFRHTGSQHPIGRRISQSVIVHSHNKLP